jgi:hypothetical protein
MRLYGVIAPVPMRFALTVVMLWLCGQMTAQNETRYSNIRTCTLSARQAVQRLDSLTVSPVLIAVKDADAGDTLPAVLFAVRGRFLFTDTVRLLRLHPGCRRLQITYRALPYDLQAPVLRLDTTAIRRRIVQDAIEFDYTPYEPAKKPWESSGLKSTGVYTRGLSFGNSQNLVFNSKLNLQLDGKLGNDLDLTAALSDNTIPVQPDGATRQLREFDRVFIQLKRKQSSLTAGDYDLTRPNGYFSNYFKRLQGVMAESYTFYGNDTARVRAAAAVSRGKFARQTVQGVEGNQGPYRLQGGEGEKFIIVLAGTERVYIDGQPMRRGLEDDYVIDYNLGEITFTPRRLITKDSRIIIEFEYAVQTYLRSTTAANATWAMPRGKFYLNFYSEQDARNSGGAQEISPASRSRLAQAGDNLKNAFGSGIDTLDAFDPNRVMYALRDTVICGIPTPLLIYSTNPAEARYTGRFTEVPAGEGNYVLSQTAANGRVYRWSAPDPVTCQPTGNFEPVVKLIAPEMRQMWAAGSELRPSKNSFINAEVSVSNRDLNRFSPIGNRDNAGIAGFVNWRQSFRPGKIAGISAWKGGAFASLEATSRNFLSLNPYRAPEFLRDWNTDVSRDTVAEQIGRAGVSIQHTGWGNIRHEFSAFRRHGIYDGNRHFTVLSLKKNDWELAAESNILNTSGLIEQTQFLRPKFDLSRIIYRKDSVSSKPILKTGLYFEEEKNSRTASLTDTLSKLSFRYELVKIYIQTPDPKKIWQLGGFVSQRNDYAPSGTDFRQSTAAREANLNGSWSNGTAKKKTSQSLSWVLTFRELKIRAPELTTQKPLNTYLGKLDYSMSTFKNAVVFTSNYELGAGQSPKLEFNYLLVNPGDGQYAWVDRNRDSILQVDEMEIAVFPDQARYSRVAVTTPQYVRTNNVTFNPGLRIEPAAWWTKPGTRTLKTISRFSAQSSLQINRRTYSGAVGVQPWNPFQLEELADSSLVTLAYGWRNILFFNKSNPKWDASISSGDNRSRLAITTGFDARSNRDLVLHTRFNFSPAWSIETDIISGSRTSDNEIFNNRDFSIAYTEAGPKATWIPGKQFRLSGTARRRQSMNRIGQFESARQTSWNMELTWTPAAKPDGRGFKGSTSLRAKGVFANITYDGQPNTAIAYSMLEGLQNGKNFLWSVNLDRQLSKTVQLTLNYEGRKTGDNRMVHIGRAQVRALF